MSSRFAQGAIWRRWDLHIHAPGTALNNQFGGKKLDDYLTALEDAEPPAAVLGITDYCSFRTYKRVRKEFDSGRLGQAEMVLPNIEFRVTPETRKNKGVNLHLLVSPEDPDHVEMIEEALSRLIFKYKSDKIPCTYDGLKRLGKLHNPKQQDPWGQYCTGVNQFKPGSSEFVDWYEGEKWLKKNSLVAAATGDDGPKGWSHESGLAAVRDEMYRFIQVHFSASERDRTFWLGQGPDPVDTIIEKYGRLRPCVSGSDAHDLKAIQEPDPERYCWIKADPTFEGLRQILYEPEDRIWIGPTAPSRHDNDLILESLTIQNSNGWFEDVTVKLNPGLVAVIGSRGSGKTALSDLVAYSAGVDLEDEEAFLNRAGSGLKGVQLDLGWASERSSSAEIPRDPFWEYEESGVKYLSQKFVEKLCSGDQKAVQLRQEIESVVLNSLIAEEQLDYDSFDELLHDRTSALVAENQNLVDEIRDLSVRIVEVRKKLSQQKQLEKNERSIQDQIASKKKQAPKIDREEDKKLLEKLEGLKKQEQSLRQTISALQKRKLKITDLISSTQGFGRKIETFWNNFLEGLEQAQIPTDEFNEAKPEFPIDPVPLLQKHAEAISTQIARLRGPVESQDQDSNTLSSLQAKIKSTDDALKLDKKKKGVVLQLKKDIAQLEKRLATTRETLLEIRDVFPQRLKGLGDRREECYLRYFELLQQRRQVLEGLYAPLQRRLSESDEREENRLDLYIKYDVDLTQWAKEGEALFDRRKIFKEEGELLSLGRQHLYPAWSSGDGPAAQDGLKVLKQEMGSNKAEILDKLSSGTELLDVAIWLYSVDHIQLRYDLRYDGTELDKLSPGTKGIVLLVLFLALDTNDRRPLLIDQPEENLDNQSINDLLIRYFREARKHRQIILITHNPNLVVNTDADQIIVAKSETREGGLPSIAYRSGALEATDLDERLGGSIRKAVIGILEGGEDAFRMRERKLGFQRN